MCDILNTVRRAKRSKIWASRVSRVYRVLLTVKRSRSDWGHSVRFRIPQLYVLKTAGRAKRTNTASGVCVCGRGRVGTYCIDFLLTVRCSRSFFNSFLNSIFLSLKGIVVKRSEPKLGPMGKSFVYKDTFDS